MSYEYCEYPVVVPDLFIISTFFTVWTPGTLSNLMNKSFNKIDNFNIEVELKVIDKNKITFKFDKYNNQQSKIDITNYYI